MGAVFSWIAAVGGLALGWYAGHEPFSPLPIEWRYLIVIGGVVLLAIGMLGAELRSVRR